MDSTPERTEGIILRITPFQDYHQILTLLTADLGLIKVFVHYANHPSSKKNFIQSFCRIELIASKGQGDLYYYKDGSLLENYYSKSSPETAPHFLSGATILSQSLLSSQFLGKPAPKLFQLLAVYLKGMAYTSAIQHLISSFQLKLLAHEGLLTAEPYCAVCRQELTSFGLGNGGEFYCKAHTSAHSLFLEEVEGSQLLLLAKGRTLQEIVKQPLEPHLPWKINQFFEQAIQS